MPIYPSSPSLVPSVASWPSGDTSYITSDPNITYTVKAIWADVTDTSIQFDISTFGEGDKFSNALIADFSSGSVDTISGVQSIQIKRGRDDNLEAFGMGECVVTINDPTGRYNPANESGVLYGKLRPMRQVLVQATLSGQTTALFRGYIRSIDFTADGVNSTARLTVGDLFLYLNRNKPVFFNANRETTTGEVLTAMLAGAGWDTSQLTSLQTGDVIPSPGVGNASTGETGISIIQQLMEIERGDFYIADDGTVTFKQRNDRAKRDTSATFSNVSGYIVASSDLERVKNKAAVVKQTASSSFTADWSDGVSVANYGQQDFSTISSFYIYDATQALSLAQWLVVQRSNPLVMFRAIEITVDAIPSAAALYAMLAELSDRIIVTTAAVGSVAKGYYIEGIEHSISPAMHKVKFSLIPVLFDAFILDSLTSGLLDTNALSY